jgi:Raf kinase inhibitor-like YbhB/YbcL family protein
VIRVPLSVGLLAAAAIVVMLDTAAVAEGPAAEDGAATLGVTSSAFTAGGQIPRKYTKEGENISPPLEWSGVPAQAKELALIVDDPDAPQAHPWVHWVAYKIPADSHGLAEGAKSGLVAGKNSFGELRYDGPMPPPGHGVHHYHFKLYALDVPIDGTPGKTKGALLEAMEGHVLARGELAGTYERK